MSDTNPEDVLDSDHVAPESLAFLVGSWNRYEVLDALEKTARTRDELRDLTGVSRPTLSRILSDLTDRGWVLRRNAEYAATPTGAAVATEVGQLVADLAAVERLGPALEWIETDQLGFDLGHLADAELLSPSPEDHTGPMRRLAARIDATDEMRTVATGVTYEVVRTIGEASAAGELQFRCVMDEPAIAGVRANPELAELFVAMIQGGHGEALRYRGDEELLDFNVIDDAVMLCGISEEGLPKGIILTEDATVRSWAKVKFELLREASDPLAADAFTV